MADKYTRNPGKGILPNRLIYQLDGDSDIQAVPTTVKKIEWDSVGDVLKIEFNDDIGDASAAETAMDSIITAHNGDALTNGTISPTQLTADVNNWNPDNLHEASILRVSSDADGIKITGMLAGSDGDEKMFINTGLKSLKLTHNDILSSSGNRFLCPSSSDYTLDHDTVCVIRYFGDDAAWRIIYASKA